MADNDPSTKSASHPEQTGMNPVTGPAGIWSTWGAGFCIDAHFQQQFQLWKWAPGAFLHHFVLVSKAAGRRRSNGVLQQNPHGETLQQHGALCRNSSQRGGIICWFNYPGLGETPRQAEKSSHGSAVSSAPLRGLGAPGHIRPSSEGKLTSRLLQPGTSSPSQQIWHNSA